MIALIMLSSCNKNDIISDNLSDKNKLKEISQHYIKMSSNYEKTPVWWVTCLYDAGGAWEGGEVGGLLTLGNPVGVGVGAFIGGAAASAMYAFGKNFYQNGNDDDFYFSNSNNSYDYVGELHNRLLNEMDLARQTYIKNGIIDTLGFYNAILLHGIQIFNNKFNTSYSLRDFSLSYNQFCDIVKKSGEITHNAFYTGNPDGDFIINEYLGTIEQINDKKIFLEYTIAFENQIAISNFSDEIKRKSFCFLSTARCSCMYWY